MRPRPTPRRRGAAYAAGTMHEDPAPLPARPEDPAASAPATLRQRLQALDRRLRRAIAERPVLAGLLAATGAAVLTQTGAVVLRRALAAKAPPARPAGRAWPAFGWPAVAALPDRRRAPAVDDGTRSSALGRLLACRIPRRLHFKGHNMLEQAQGTVNEIAGKVQGAFGRATNDTATHLEGQARETLGKAQQVYGDALDQVRESAVKNPLGTIAVAAGVGLLVGLLCSRR
ncbi:MAG: CsbD family protein [Pseudorhodoferax sp.]